MKLIAVAAIAIILDGIGIVDAGFFDILQNPMKEFDRFTRGFFDDPFETNDETKLNRQKRFDVDVVKELDSIQAMPGRVINKNWREEEIRQVGNPRGDIFRPSQQIFTDNPFEIPAAIREIAAPDFRPSQTMVSNQITVKDIPKDLPTVREAPTDQIIQITPSGMFNPAIVTEIDQTKETIQKEIDRVTQFNPFQQVFQPMMGMFEPSPGIIQNLGALDRFDPFHEIDQITRIDPFDPFSMNPFRPHGLITTNIEEIQATKVNPVRREIIRNDIPIKEVPAPINVSPFRPSPEIIDGPFRPSPEIKNSPFRPSPELNDEPLRPSPEIKINPVDQLAGTFKPSPEIIIRPDETRVTVPSHIKETITTITETDEILTNFINHVDYPHTPDTTPCPTSHPTKMVTPTTPIPKPLNTSTTTSKKNQHDRLVGSTSHFSFEIFTPKKVAKRILNNRQESSKKRILNEFEKDAKEMENQMRQTLADLNSFKMLFPKSDAPFKTIVKTDQGSNENHQIRTNYGHVTKQRAKQKSNMLSGSMSHFSFEIVTKSPGEILLNPKNATDTSKVKKSNASSK